MPSVFPTVMETIAAVHAGLRVLALSTITNINDPDRPAPAKLETIIDVAEQNAPALRRLIVRWLSASRQERINDPHSGPAGPPTAWS